MARRANKNSGGSVTVRVVATQVHQFEGRSVESVEEDGGYLVVSMKPPRRSKFVKHRFPLSTVIAYKAGEGGKGGAYALVKTTYGMGKPVVGDIEVGEGYISITDAEGEVHTFMDCNPDDGIEIIVTEESDGAAAGGSKKKGKKAAPAKKSRRAADEDEDEDEDEEAEDEDEDEDESDEDESDEEEDDEEEEKPARRKKAPAKPARGAKASSKKTAAKPARGKAPAAKAKGRRVADW